jgi:NTE family protein
MAETGSVAAPPAQAHLPGQVVLVLQGGGALGAYQIGVLEALTEAAITPHWIIGTSIGAINGAIIAGNRPEKQLAQLREFWYRMTYHSRSLAGLIPGMAALANITQGIPAFFTPNPTAWLGLEYPLPLEQTAYYFTDALRDTLGELVDFEYLNQRAMRLTVGAVNANSGEMRYFDSRSEPLSVSHIMASGALPPAFPAVLIDGEPYWDGGIFSNTPIEAVLNDNPRRDSVIFSVQLWNPAGPEPHSMAQVMGKQKDIQYASRNYQIERQQQLHHLRHVIRQLASHAPDHPQVRELATWGCGTCMHVIKLNLPIITGETHAKDMDFTPAGIAARQKAGYAATMRVIAKQPWLTKVDQDAGILIHEDV